MDGKIQRFFHFHRNMGQKNVIFRPIKIFENFQIGLGTQIFWFLETSVGVDCKIQKSTNFFNFENSQKFLWSEKSRFFEHRKIDSKNLIFRFIKIFEKFQIGLGTQIFWVLETSVGVDCKIQKSTNFSNFENSQKFLWSEKSRFFEHRKIDSKNLIFRFIKFFENFQNGLWTQIF